MLICRVVFILLVVGLVRCCFYGVEPVGLWFAFCLAFRIALVLAFRTSPRRVEGAGFEPAKAWPSDLQSDPFDRLGIPPKRGKSQIIAQNAPLCQVISPIFKIFFHPPTTKEQIPPFNPRQTRTFNPKSQKTTPPSCRLLSPPCRSQSPLGNASRQALLGKSQPLRQPPKSGGESAPVVDYIPDRTPPCVKSFSQPLKSPRRRRPSGGDAPECQTFPAHPPSRAADEKRDSIAPHSICRPVLFQ